MSLTHQRGSDQGSVTGHLDVQAISEKALLEIYPTNTGISHRLQINPRKKPVTPNVGDERTIAQRKHPLKELFGQICWTADQIFLVDNIHGCDTGGTGTWMS